MLQRIASRAKVDFLSYNQVRQSSELMPNACSLAQCKWSILHFCKIHRQQIAPDHAQFLSDVQALASQSSKESPSVLLRKLHDNTAPLGGVIVHYSPVFLTADPLGWSRPCPHG